MTSVLSPTATDRGEPDDAPALGVQVNGAIRDLVKLGPVTARLDEEHGSSPVLNNRASTDDPSGDSISFAMKEEIDSRSIFVSNVDYGCGPEELQEHFQNCGTINRVTIATDSFGQPKGYAYVEFAEANAVQNALKLTETELHGRRLRVSPKRTNIPGMKQFWGPFSFGKFPRFRRGRGYGPYY